jgi:predicted NUDIX family NTP pyrophosphohydrolase
MSLAGEQKAVGVPACQGVLQQYGAIPWRRDRDGAMRILLVTSRGRGRWIVPKGLRRGDRPPYLSAAMHAFVEAGVIGDIVTYPLADYCYVREVDGGVLQHCQVTLFDLHVRGTLMNWPEREQRVRGWFDPDEAAGMVQSQDLARVINAMSDCRAVMKRHQKRGRSSSPLPAT